MFEAFASLPAGWVLSPGARVTAGALELAGSSTRASSPHQDDARSADLWIEIPIQFPIGTSAQATVAVTARGPQAGAALSCRLGADGRLRFEFADGPTQATREVVTALRPGLEAGLRLVTHRATPDAPLTMWCEAGVGTALVMTAAYVAPAPDGMLATAIEATGGTCVVRYLWIIQGPLLVNPA